MRNGQRWEAIMTNAEMVDVLISKYGFLRDEMLSHIGFAKGHVKHFSLLAGDAGGLIAFLFDNAHIDLSHSGWMWVILMLLLSTVATYLYFDIIGSYFCMMCVGARLGSLETKINELAGSRLLLWETVGSDRLLLRER